jgi:hypothetical protein
MRASSTSPYLEVLRDRQEAAVAAAVAGGGGGGQVAAAAASLPSLLVGPAGYCSCSPRHPTHFEPRLLFYIAPYDVT